MKKKGIALLALLMCLGGMTPMVLAEEIETEPEEVTVEEVQDEVTDEAEEETAIEEQENDEEAVPEESVEEATAEEQKQPGAGYEVLPTEHGTVSVSSSSEDLFHQGNLTDCRKISCTPDDGYHVASVKARNEMGIEIDLIHDDQNTYFLSKGVSVTIEALFEGNLHKLYTRTDDTHPVKFIVDGQTVTEAKAGQTVQAVIDLNENEYVSSFIIRDEKTNIGYNAELISESLNESVFEFTMIDDDATIELNLGTGGVPYIDENGDVHKIANAEKINSARDLTLTAGWYVLNGDVTIYYRVEIKGHVNLILPDDTTFTCTDGIHNREGNTLTIWGQKKGNGYLDARARFSDKAGIGGNRNENGGTFNLHGGRVNAEAGVDAAGVGGGYRGDGGIIRVYGGYLHGHGNNNGAGIGGGEYGRGGDIRIYGGTINASSYLGAGIGSGEYGDGGYIQINGGTIKVSSTAGSAIGGAYRALVERIDIYDGYIEAHSDCQIAVGNIGSKSQIHLGLTMVAQGFDFSKRYEVLYTEKDVTMYNASR